MSNQSNEAQGSGAQDALVIGGRTFSSRLFVGTGKYASVEQTRAAILASGARVVTVAVRRVDLKERGQGSLFGMLLQEKFDLLPNTAGCYTADDAIRTARLAGVDVSSGVEAAPGRKDPAKVRAFIGNAKTTLEGERG